MAGTLGGDPDEPLPFQLPEAVENSILRQRLKNNLGHLKLQERLILHHNLILEQPPVALLLQVQIMADMLQLLFQCGELASPV
ncbi:hypothetical protein D3C75_1229820 [compost metagenome]